MDYKNAPPPPYGFQAPPPHQPPTTFVVAAPARAMSVPLGPHSCSLTCPSCHATISTRVEKEATVKTHLFALLLCLIFCPCVIVPYCTDSCKATNHYCPSCGAYLGAYDH